jgi:hypothetical protein
MKLEEKPTRKSMTSRMASSTTIAEARRLLGRLQGENRERVNRIWTLQVREEVIRSGGGLPGDDQEEREKRA